VDSRDETFRFSIREKGMETPRVLDLSIITIHVPWHVPWHAHGDILFLLDWQSLRPRRYFALSSPRKHSRTHPLSLRYSRTEHHRVISQGGYVRAWWCIISTIFSGESSYEGPFRNTELIMSEGCKSLSKNLHVKSVYVRTQKMAMIRRFCLFNLHYLRQALIRYR